jgi:hypothetical protein
MRLTEFLELSAGTGSLAGYGVNAMADREFNKHLERNAQRLLTSGRADAQEALADLGTGTGKRAGSRSRLQLGAGGLSIRCLTLLGFSSVDAKRLLETGLSYSRWMAARHHRSSTYTDSLGKWPIDLRLTMGHRSPVPNRPSAGTCRPIVKLDRRVSSGKTSCLKHRR